MPLSELKASVKMLFWRRGGGEVSSGTLSPSPNLLHISLNVEGAFSGLLFTLCLVLLKAPIDNRQLFASEGATLSGIN